MNQRDATTILSGMETEHEHEIEADPLPEHAAAVMGRLAPNAFGIAAGTVSSLALFFVTIVPVLRGDPHLADHIWLLAEYLYGFSVSASGALIGAAYGFAIGYALGYLFAIYRNFGVSIYLRFIWRRAEHHFASDLLDI